MRCLNNDIAAGMSAFIRFMNATVTILSDHRTIDCLLRLDAQVSTARTIANSSSKAMFGLYPLSNNEVSNHKAALHSVPNIIPRPKCPVPVLSANNMISKLQQSSLCRKGKDFSNSEAHSLRNW